MTSTFPSTNKTNYLILFDFDETYYPHKRSQSQLEKLMELEDFLYILAREHQVKIGWITGSSLEHIRYKMELAKLKFYPHFIGSNLGTELFFITKNGDFQTSPEWMKKIKRSGFSNDQVHHLYNELKNTYGIQLQEQTQHGQSPYKYNYYYYMESDVRTEYDLLIIKQQAKNHSIQVNINRCNPKAGDPEEAYDVDFIPQETGKAAIAAFVKNYYNVPYNHTIAFGDSGNDIDMLKSVKHGYLLQNATEEAKSLHQQIAPKPYAEGILYVLRNLFTTKEVGKVCT
ncbi:HAD-IIB family hydrolase [Cerasibacillus sp. JNUCC 74]